jgi:hypothetical protein
VPVQRCTVHKHRNLLAHAPDRLHEEITADYTDMMIYATTREVDGWQTLWQARHPLDTPPISFPSSSTFPHSCSALSSILILNDRRMRLA